MHCPACGAELVEMLAGEVRVDVCAHRCGGIWFDAFELDGMVAPRVTPAPLLCLEQIESPPPDEAPRLCPRCPGQPLTTRYSSVLKRVELEECPGCGGTWLDFGELARIREEHGPLAQDREAAEKEFARQFQGLLDAALVSRISQAERMGGPLRALDFVHFWMDSYGDGYSHFQSYYDNLRRTIRRKERS